MIEINNVNFSIQDHPVIRDVTFTIDDGEIVGIIGVAGSGKSVLLRIISGLLKGNEGGVVINGVNIAGFSRHDMQKIVSYFTDREPENSDDTVYNFSLLSRTPYKNIFRPFSEYDLQVTDEYMENFSLAGHKEVILGQLSESMLKKVMLAHAFIREAPLLVLDNPTGNIDISSLAMLRKCLMKYVMNGERSVLMASNDLNFVLQTADRIIVLDGGSLVHQGPPDIVSADMIKKFFQTDVLISRNVYNGRPEVHLFPES